MLPDGMRGTTGAGTVWQVQLHGLAPPGQVGPAGSTTDPEALLTWVSELGLTLQSSWVKLMT